MISKNCPDCGALHPAHESRCYPCRARAAAKRRFMDVLGYTPASSLAADTPTSTRRPA